MFRIPRIVQYLNTTMKFDEIIISITELIKNIITTDHVEIYTFDTSDIVLKKVQVKGNEKEPVSYALGESLIGKAGKDRIVRIDEHFNNTMKNRKNINKSRSTIWMAVPIIIKDRLLGVIGIGKVKKVEGNESNLMRMIADIAGVALINQALLGDANRKANTDSLTGLSNRNYFFQMAQILVEKAIKEDSPISIFLFDIDNFKHYNDNNGHDAGDKLLVELSSIVSGITRKNAIFSRYGGEEFIVMLPGISRKDAFIYADRVRERICTHSFPNREFQPLGFVSISGGIASFPDDEDSLYKVIRLADAALYQAKAEGRNKVIVS
jgi:diguanylate cyclase (GGDEF)-like protein